MMKWARELEATEERQVSIRVCDNGLSIHFSQTPYQMVVVT